MTITRKTIEESVDGATELSSLAKSSDLAKNISFSGVTMGLQETRIRREPI